MPDGLKAKLVKETQEGSVLRIRLNEQCSERIFPSEIEDCPEQQFAEL